MPRRRLWSHAPSPPPDRTEPALIPHVDIQTKVLRFQIIQNVSGQEKLIITNGMGNDTSGQNNVYRYDLGGKWDQTEVVTKVENVSSGSGVWQGGTNLTVLSPDVGILALGTNVQDNSLFVEKDTARRFWFDGGTWTWANLISGFAGTWDKSPSDSQFEVSGGKLNFLENASSGGDRTWYDLGTDVSETEWLLRVRLRFTTIANQSAYPEIDLVISDNHANSDTNQDFIGCRILPMALNNLFRPRKCIAEKPRRGSSANHNPSPAFTTGKDYYIEFKRTSATNWSASLSDTDAYDGDIYSGSFTTATTSLDGLRYFTVMDGTTATSGNMEGYIDVFEFYNGVTSPP